LQQFNRALILYTAAPIPDSAATILWCNLCSPTSTFCFLIDSDLEPTYRRRRTTGHQVRIIDLRSATFTQYGEFMTALFRDWREKQEAEIKARDEASKARRQETISKAERSIDEFYEDYAKKKERNIRDNK
jgi:hypothetical protein